MYLTFKVKIFVRLLLGGEINIKNTSQHLPASVLASVVHSTSPAIGRRLPLQTYTSSLDKPYGKIAHHSP